MAVIHSKNEKEQPPEVDKVTERKAKKHRRTLAAVILAVVLIVGVVFAIVKAAKPADKAKGDETLSANPTASANVAVSEEPDVTDNTAESSGETETDWSRAEFGDLKDVEVGAVVRFGAYEQDNDASDGKESIEWIVLDRRGDRILVLSKFALDRQQYNETFILLTWETCTLRSWLNETFFRDAFSADEQSRILTVTVPADKNPSYDTPPGNDTEDRVFLFSMSEVDRYLGTDDARQCTGTAYCYAQGAYQAKNGNCWWWLRTPGSRSSYAVYVVDDGAVRAVGGSVSGLGNHFGTGFGAVRPAMWISLEPSKGNEQLSAERSASANPAVSENPDDAQDSSGETTEEADTSSAEHQDLKAVEVGAVVLFGTYEQDNDRSDGKEEIEWIVLAVEDDRALLLSKYGLDTLPYNSVRDVTMTWEKSSLRSWLIGEFFQNAFDETEQERILKTTVSAHRNPAYDANPGSDTEDRIFLLSMPEANSYFDSESARQCEATPYCYARGASKAKNGNCFWWLRSIGLISGTAMVVINDGSIVSHAFYVNHLGGSIRPAIWISLEP